MKVSALSDHVDFADALRAAAIFLVVFNHLFLFGRPTIAGHLITFWALGLWGLNCFFVLTGFLLGRPYLKSLIDGTRFPSTKNFFVRRFWRVYPLYFVAVVASIFAETAYLHTPPTLTSIASHLFILQGLSIETVTSLNGPLWTMGIDLGFYLALPFVALGLRRLLRDRSRSVRIRVVLGTILAVAAASLAYRYVGYLTHPVAAKDINADLVYVRNVFGYACSFMIGVGVALAMVTGVRISRFAAIGFVIAGIVLATLDARGVDGVELKLLRVTLLDPILALSVACVLFGAAQHPSRLVTRIVSAKVVTTAAALSYGIYLFHWPLIECLDTFWLHGNSGNDPFMKLTLVTFAIILPLAFVLNRLIEVPILAMRDRNRAPGIAAVPAPAPKSIAQKLPESVSPNLTASS